MTKPECEPRDILTESRDLWLARQLAPVFELLGGKIPPELAARIKAYGA